MLLILETVSLLANVFMPFFTVYDCRCIEQGATMSCYCLVRVTLDVDGFTF